MKSYGIKFLPSIGNLLWFLAKNWVKIIIPPLLQLKFDDVTVTLSLIVLSRIFFNKLTLILFYLTPKFVEVEYHLHD